MIHAGDFLAEGMADVLRKFPNLRFKIVRGNCDVNKEALAEIAGLANVELAKVLTFEIGGRKFAAAHRAEDLPKDGEAEILISGHTHIPQVKRIGAKLFLNPGSLQDDGGYFLMDLENLEVRRKLFAEKISAN